MLSTEKMDKQRDMNMQRVVKHNGGCNLTLAVPQRDHTTLDETKTEAILRQDQTYRFIRPKLIT